MKKTVTYKGKEYEVRWEKWERWEEYLDRDMLVVYEVQTRKILGIQFKKNIQVYICPQSHIENTLYTPKNDPNYYIELIKKLFKNVEKEEFEKQLKQRVKDEKLKYLEECDGVIDEESKK